MPWKLTADAQDNWINYKYDRPRGFFHSLYLTDPTRKDARKKEKIEKERGRAEGEGEKRRPGIGMVSLRCHDCQGVHTMESS